jgi:CHAT domain-containing protein/tetratricopeptide (TPR) repeat protein
MPVPPTPVTRGGSSVEDLRRASLSRLAWPEDRQSIDQAVAGLEEAVGRAPGDAQAWSDLSAGYLVLAQEDDDPGGVIRALEAAEKAVGLQGDLPEARFNQALLLERIGARSDARRAWQAYLALDGTSPWAEEARAHVQALAQFEREVVWTQERQLLEEAAVRGDGAAVRAIVDRNRQLAREDAEQDLLGLWAEARDAGRPADAAKALTTARLIGNALVELDVDTLVRDAVAVIDEAIAAGDGPRLLLLTAGHRAFRQGFPLYKKYDTRSAVDLFERSRRALAQARSPFEKRIAFWLACAANHLNDFAGAAASLERLDTDLSASHAWSLLGHIAWMRGYLHLIQGDPMAALSFYSRSLRLFEKTGEDENVAALNSLIGESLDLLGDSREAWRYEFKSLQMAHQVRDLQIQYIILHVAERHFLAQKPAMALHVQSELARRFAPVDNPLLQAEAFLWRGLLESQAGNREQALRDLARVDRLTAKVKDADIRRDLEIDLAMIEGGIRLETEPVKAADLLTSALATYEAKGHHLLAMMARKARAHAYRAAGELDRAEEDLRAGLGAYEKLGEDVFKEEIRSAFVDQAEEIFREMIAFLSVERRRPDLAFPYADRSRTRILPSAVLLPRAAGPDRERLLLKDRQPLETEEIRRSLPERTSLVQFASLDDRLVIWLLRRDGMETFIERVPADEMRALVGRARNVGHAPKAGGKALAALFDHLVSPWLDRVGADRIIFVPDTHLEGVPFSCLRDRQGHYLMEGHEIVIAPSASLYAQAVNAPAPPMALEDRGLVVGNPALGGELLLRLRNLPFAEEEAKRIAGQARGSRLLLGKAATRGAFLDGLQRSSWVHFAGHGLVNRQNPLLSMLVLAPASDGSDPGALYARDIYGLDLRGLRLVVLGACDSAEGVSDGGGGASLARAFLAAGARTVLAALWEIDDRASEELFAAFYDRLKRGLAPATALREAQLAMIHSQDSALRSPVAWAGFQVIGAD